MSTTDLDALLEEEATHAERSEQVIDDGAELPQGVKMTRGHGRSRTLQVRLTDDEYQRLSAVANDEGLPVSTVARSLLMSSLTAEDSFESLLDVVVASVTRARLLYRSSLEEQGEHREGARVN